ncbi:MAG: adenylosuccinate synthase [Verrucomicrobia bacterium]|nr:adenylosuccinate synthase [Verrucomicrobiota bacterium]
MPAIAVVGANWGDEGKGKIADYLAGQADVVARFQGGNNAGHTVINDYGKFALHLLPSGVFHSGVVNVLGPGVAINIAAFVAERQELISRGVPEPQLRVSDRAQVVLPYHLLLDEYEEQRLADRQFGSTKAGIAPFYADKCLKLGIQVADLWNPRRLRERLTASLVPKNILLEHLYQKPTIEPEELLPDLLAQGERIRPFACDTVRLLQDALAGGKRVLLEGQLGALRDPDHGVLPYPTSSSPLAGFASVGAGVPPQQINRIVAVVKAYSSCVGAGPFVTELSGDAADELRARGGDAGEYGATTGRPRRVGWFDAVATRYGAGLQGATELALSNLDVLGYLDEIPICTAYEVNGRRTDRFLLPVDLDRARPLFESLRGWKCNISSVRTFDELPEQAQEYVRRIEQLVEVPVRIISVGSARDATIARTTRNE